MSEEKERLGAMTVGEFMTHMESRPQDQWSVEERLQLLTISGAQAAVKVAAMEEALESILSATKTSIHLIKVMNKRVSALEGLLK